MTYELVKLTKKEVRGQDDLSLRKKLENISRMDKNVAIDARSSDMMGSSTYGWMAGAYKELEDRGNRLFLITDSKLVIETLEITGLDARILVYDSEEKLKIAKPNI